jgi:hypothetical protein
MTRSKRIPPMKGSLLLSISDCCSAVNVEVAIILFPPSLVAIHVSDSSPPPAAAKPAATNL